MLGKSGNGIDGYWFSVIVAAVGAILIFAAIIRGSIMFFGFIKGYYAIRTINDLSINVIGIAFNFVIPLIGGVLLLLSGRKLFEIEKNYHKNSIRSWSKSKKKIYGNKMIKNMLSQTENQIIEIIRQRNGYVLQSDLVGLSGYSKVKVHRIIKSLENKGIIRRTRHGITNKIFLVNSQPS